jgi:hypothetical protein
MGVGREALEMVLHRLVEQLVVGEQVGEPAQLVAVGKMAHDNQVGHLNEGGFLREFLDWNAAVAQNTFLAIDEGDLAQAGSCIGVAIVQGDVTRRITKRRNVHCQFIFRASAYREFVTLSVQNEFRFFIHNANALKHHD